MDFRTDRSIEFIKHKLYHPAYRQSGVKALVIRSLTAYENIVIGQLPWGKACELLEHTVEAAYSSESCGKCGFSRRHTFGQHFCGSAYTDDVQVLRKGHTRHSAEILGEIRLAEAHKIGSLIKGHIGVMLGNVAEKRLVCRAFRGFFSASAFSFRNISAITAEARPEHITS